MKNDPFNSKIDWPALRLNGWRCRSAIQSNWFKARGRYIGLKMFNTEHPSRRERGTLWEDPWMYWRRTCSRLEWQRIGGDADDLTAETLDASLGSCLYTEQIPFWLSGRGLWISCFGCFCSPFQTLVVIYLVLQMWFHFWLSSRCVQIFESSWFQRGCFSGLSSHETFGSLLEFEP